MYLIHVGLRAPSAQAALPARAADLVRAQAPAHIPVEHVSAHPHARPSPVLGVYLLADGLEEAEHRAEALCRHATRSVPELSGWSVGRVGAPLVTAYYERLLDAASGLPGRIGPGPFPST
ncbi:hypothetical protein [Streptomyces sp. NPDC046161]|uniref:hypothetical protein n=1 Tax=Streptomyces sp. NPDC046161 TaxID=3155132 RepID=UPI0034058338